MTVVTRSVEKAQRPAPIADLAPLVVDVDGVLIPNGLTAEAALVHMRGGLQRALPILAWLMRGPRLLRRRLAERVELDVADLPVDAELVRFMEAEHARGRKIHLAVEGDASLAARLAQRFGFVDGVIASEGGETKARVLRERFPGGFAYAGRGGADAAVWRVATERVVVGRDAAGADAPLAVIPRRGPSLRTVAKAARVHQWAKNALVAVPLVLGGRAFDPEAWMTVLAGFLLLGVLASSTYVLNDLWDLDDDRRHWSKRERAFASGRLSIGVGLIAAPIGIVAAMAGAAMIGAATFASFAAYLVVTLAYSLRLKRVAVLDVFLLASLFTLRLVIGIALSAVPGSPWLLVFSMFVFASLSFAKRHTEMVRVALSGAKKAAGRGYVAADAPFLIGMGVATGMSAVLVMVLYLIDEAFRAGFYTTPAALWAFPCVLFLWLGRVWVLSGRDELHDDPVAFAVKDGPSLMLGGVMAIAFMAAVWPKALVFW